MLKHYTEFEQKEKDKLDRDHKTAIKEEKEMRIDLEMIDLYKVLELENLYKEFAENQISKRNVPNNWKNPSFAGIHILSFDVDRYYGAIYIVTSNNYFFRIQRVYDDIDNMDEHKEIFEDKFSIYPWKITHKTKLRDVLKDGLPLGICTIKYDSVTGRVIIADNYKIQALYI